MGPRTLSVAPCASSRWHGEHFPSEARDETRVIWLIREELLSASLKSMASSMGTSGGTGKSEETPPSLSPFLSTPSFLPPLMSASPRQSLGQRVGAAFVTVELAIWW